jgi:hypothetical protein
MSDKLTELESRRRIEEGGWLAALGVLLELRCVVLRWFLWREQGYKPLHGFQEVAGQCFHSEIDGIVVDFTGEAATEVGARIDDGDQFATPGALERQLARPHFVRPLPMFQ